MLSHYQQESHVLNSEEFLKLGWTHACLSAISENGEAETVIGRQHRMDGLCKIAVTPIDDLFIGEAPGGGRRFAVTNVDLKDCLQPWYLELLTRKERTSALVFEYIPNGRRPSLHEQSLAQLELRDHPVPVPFQKATQEYTCNETAMAMGIWLAGHEVQAKAMLSRMTKRQNDQEHMKKIFNGKGKGIGENWHQLNMIVKNVMQMGDTQYRRFNHNAEFNPRKPGAYAEDPIVAQLLHKNSLNHNHIYVFYQDRIYDSEQKFALKLCRESLDWLGGPGAVFIGMQQVRKLTTSRCQRLVRQNNDEHG